MFEVIPLVVVSFCGSRVMLFIVSVLILVVGCFEGLICVVDCTGVVVAGVVVFETFCLSS